MPLEGKVCLLRTIRELDGVPIVLATHYFSASRFPDFLERFEEFKSVSKLWIVTAWVIMNGNQLILVRGCQIRRNSKSQTTSQPAGINNRVINVDSFGEPIEFGISAFSADRTNLIVES